MKNYQVKIEYTGLTGKYINTYDVKAKNAKSAENKASQAIGNRDAVILEVKEGN